MQSVEKLKDNITEFNSLTELGESDNKVFVQQVFSTPHYAVLKIRSPGKSLYIYLGRGADYQGFHLSLEPPPSEIRIRDRYLEYLRKHLRGGRLKSANTFGDDKSVELSYFLGKEIHRLIFFWKGRSFYFSHLTPEECFSSWKGKVVFNGAKLEVDYLEKIFSEIGWGASREIGKKENFKSSDIEIYLNGNSWARQREGKNNKRLAKSKSRKMTKINEDIDKLKSWVDLWPQLESDEINLEGRTPLAEKYKLKIKFTDEQSYFKRKSIIFDKLKNYKKHLSLLESRLAETKEELSLIEGKQHVENEPLNIKNVKIIQPIWTMQTEKKSDSSQEYLSFILNGSIKGFLGKSARGNDYIRKACGHKDDLWFHTYGEKSPHLILKIPNITELSSREIEAVGGLIAEGMGSSSGSLELIYTNLSGVKGKKGVPGTVILKRPRYLSVFVEGDRWKEIITIL